MENVLMCLCRTTHRYNVKQIAAKLGITPNEYTELETSARAMTPAQAERLAAVYSIDAEYFLESSRQLELLLTRAEVIKHLQSENIRLQKFVEVTHKLLHNSKTEDETNMNVNAGYGQETTRQ